MEYQIIWDCKTLTVTLDFLHDDFEITIIPFLYFVNKDLEKIQQIVIFTKTANRVKQTTSQTIDVSIMTKKKPNGR